MEEDGGWRRERKIDVGERSRVELEDMEVESRRETKYLGNGYLGFIESSKLIGPNHGALATGHAAFRNDV